MNVEGVTPRFSTRLTTDLIVLAALLSLAAILWIPSGFKTTGLMEDWLFYRAFDRGEVALGSAITEQPTRPFLLLMHWVGYLITPDSFVGLNLAAVVCFVLKGYCLFVLVRMLVPDHVPFAVACGVLFALFPADAGLFNARYIAYQWMSFTFIASIIFFLRFDRRPNLLNLAGMWLFQFFCLGTYETAYPLMFVCPILLWLFPRNVSHRRRIYVSAAWLFFPLAYLVFSVVVYQTQKPFYQNNLVRNAESQLDIGVYLQSIANAYYENIVGGWFRAVSIGQTPQFSMFHVALSLFGLAIIVTAMWSVWYSFPPNRLSRSNAVKLIIVGLVVIGLGFLPYVLIRHRSFNERVFIVTSIGASLIVITLILLLVQRIQQRSLSIAGVASLVVGILGLFALYGGIGQRANLQRLSLVQQRLLSDMVTAVPVIPDGTIILIRDTTNRLRTIPELFVANASSRYFASAVAYLYSNPAARVQICYPESGTWGETPENCAFDEAGVKLFGEYGFETYPYDKIFVFDFTSDDRMNLLYTIPPDFSQQPRITTYDPLALISASAPVPVRVLTLFNNKSGIE